MHNLQQRDSGLPPDESQMKVAPEHELTKKWYCFAKEVEIGDVIGTYEVVSRTRIVADLPYPTSESWIGYGFFSGAIAGGIAYESKSFASLRMTDHKLLILRDL